ncbi:hypothetical protein FO519_004703 [Halicephalobus sp. NKZ332]|nr:hypothetical protein FO519_004703 [Halicephalobus sp. NKZ332]
MGLTTQGLERWTEGKKVAENPNEAPSRKPVSGVNLKSDIVPLVRYTSNLSMIPGTSSSTAQSQESFIIRQNYTTEVEAAVNKQINIELHASYVYLSMSYYFDRGDVALPNIAKWLKKQSDEKREHAHVLMKYQNTRGGRIFFQNIQRPETDEWGSASESFQAALALEEFINNALLELYSLVSEHNNPQMCSDSWAQDAPATSGAPGTPTSTPTPLVPILMSMNPDERQELDKILVNQSLTVGEMDNAVDNFFNGSDIDPSLKSQYLAMKQAFAESLQILDEEHAKMIQNASPECQNADAEIRGIANDKSLTMVQQNTKIMQVYQAQTPEVQKELDQYAIYKRNGQNSSSSSSGF